MAKPPDIQSLTAAQLDALIIQCAARRASMTHPPIGDRPSRVAAYGPAEWYTELVDVGSLLQIKHPGLGWLAFIIGHDHRDLLVKLLREQSAVVTQHQPAPSSSTTDDATTPPPVIKH